MRVRDDFSPSVMTCTLAVALLPGLGLHSYLAALSACRFKVRF